MTVEVPHFAYPFRFERRSDGSMTPVVYEQHSVEEVASCVATIVLTPVGQRDELPDFGVTPQTFRSPPLDINQLLTEISEWEDRADVTALTFIDSIDPGVQYIVAQIRSVEEGALTIHVTDES